MAKACQLYDSTFNPKFIRKCMKIKQKSRRKKRERYYQVCRGLFTITLLSPFMLRPKTTEIFTLLRE